MLQAAVAAVLAAVRNLVEDVARDEESASVHDLGDGGPELRLISPLADGSDRLVAREALRQGYQLDVVLPFAEDDYERTMKAGAATAFRALLRAAGSPPGPRRVLTLDGASGSLRRESYTTVGQFILRNCDLLIAIWDGEPANGRGGTGDVVKGAIAIGLPVWWIDPDGGHAPQLLGVPAHAGEAVQDALGRLIRQSLRPLEAGRPPAHGSLGALAQWLDGVFGLTATPLEDYLREALPGRPLIRGAYAAFMCRVSPLPAEEERVAPPPEGAVEEWWEGHHVAAAALSKAYGDRYRSSYVLVFLLAAFALVSAASGFVVPHGLHVPVAILELSALTFIALLVGANHLYRWHDRWISYRLLAELCRTQRVLAPIGWTLPVRDVARIVAAEPAHGAAREGRAPREAWVAWYFAAIRRAAPMPAGVLAGPALERARRVALGIFEDQQSYHRMRRHRCEDASRRLAHWGDMFFLLALLGVVARIALELFHAPPWSVSVIGVACFASPAVSATLLGIRAYAEFELLARQSARMQQAMAETLLELDALRLDRPLASNALGGVLSAAVTAMLLDIDGWAQLFRVKSVEAG